MQVNNISAKTIARIVELAATKPLSREYGEALAQALQEASETKPATLKLGQRVLVNGKTAARVVDIARNGIWILRSATEGEWIRTGRDQIRERVSVNTLMAA